MNWRRRAICRYEDPELFFPIGDELFPGGTPNPAVVAQINEAKAVCHRCPVISDCLTWALENGQDAGVWGGQSEVERRPRMQRMPDEFRTPMAPRVRTRSRSR
jgi:WhiB family redox-sensing transcriptional regulator